MNPRTLIAVLTLGALAATPAIASASSTAFLQDVGEQSLAALDGTVVQIAGDAPSHTLMVRRPGGAFSPLPGAPQALYRAIDLGHDARGRLVLTYIRCSDNTNCVAYSDDLAGHRVSFKHLAPKRCSLTSDPARWGSRVAYALTCTKPHGKPGVRDASRSGLYVSNSGGAARRLSTPHGKAAYVDRVDLRGTTIGAVAPGNRSYAFSQTVTGKHMRTNLITDNQGETDDYTILGMALGGRGAVWSLVVDSEEEGRIVNEPISRLGATSCEVEDLPVAVDMDTYQPMVPVRAIAVDADTLYLATHAGVVAHAFSPDGGCRS
jgi:hypothetical protein